MFSWGTKVDFDPKWFKQQQYRCNKVKSLHVKSAFLQGQTINRSVLSQPPKEASTKKLWKLLINGNF